MADQPGYNQYLTSGPTQTLRVFAILLGAGAFDAAPTEVPCVGYRVLTIAGEYTQAAAGGAVNMEIQWSPWAADVVAPALSWFPIVAYAVGAVAVNVDTQSLLQAELVQYGSVGAVREPFSFEITLPTATERVRVACAESGVVGNPGDCGLTALFSL